LVTHFIIINAIYHSVTEARQHAEEGNSLCVYRVTCEFGVRFSKRDYFVMYAILFINFLLVLNPVKGIVL